MSLIARSEHERGPEQHHLAVVAIRERDEALLRAGKAEGEAESLRQQLVGAVDAYLGELVAESRAICEREGVKNLAEWIGKTVLARVTGEGQ